MNPKWGNCHFIFDVEAQEYDWLAVYQDLPSTDSFFCEEFLHCPREKTILLTGEPSSITVFGTDYLRQFGAILTFQEPWAMRHHRVIFHHPGLIWHYGLGNWDDNCISWDTLNQTSPPRKDKLLSTVCSARVGKTTLHSSRVNFTWWLKDHIDGLDIYGHGVNPMADKCESLDRYHYHIAIENHVFKHHLTEKLPDSFLGFTLPFYHGAPNAADYFPKESFIPINIHNRQRSLEIIRHHINNDEYNDRLPYIKKAREHVLNEQNLFAILSKNIEELDRQPLRSHRNGVIYNRTTMRIKKPIAGIRSLTEKAAIKAYHRFYSQQRARKDIPPLSSL